MSVKTNVTTPVGRPVTGSPTLRKAHGETRPARFGLHLERAAVIGHDSMRDCQPKPGAFARALWS